MRDQLMESYLAQYERAGRNIARRKKELVKFLDFISTEHFDRFDYDTVQFWIRKRKRTLSEGAVQIAQNHISDFSEWARLFDRSIGKIPKYGHVRLDRRKPKILDRHEVLAIMDAQSAQNSRRNINPKSFSVITGLLFATGLRLYEALRLKDKDIDLEARTIYIAPGKGARDRTITVSNSTRNVLSEYVEWRNIKHICPAQFFIFDFPNLKRPDTIYRPSFNRVAEDMGYRCKKTKGFSRSNLTVHDLRHSFAVNALKRAYETDADILDAIVQLSSILGHEKFEDTYWYIEGVPELLSAALCKVSS